MGRYQWRSREGGRWTRDKSDRVRGGINEDVAADLSVGFCGNGRHDVHRVGYVVTELFLQQLNDLFRHLWPEVGHRKGETRAVVLGLAVQEGGEQLPRVDLIECVKVLTSGGETEVHVERTGLSFRDSFQPKKDLHVDRSRDWIRWIFEQRASEHLERHLVLLLLEVFPLQQLNVLINLLLDLHDGLLALLFLRVRVPLGRRMIWCRSTVRVVGLLEVV